MERELDREMKGAARPMKQSQLLIKKLRKKVKSEKILGEKGG